MQETTPDGLATPENGDPYNIVADLAAFAATVQAALERRANARIGTQTERISQTPDLADGTLWKDTTGNNALWVKDSGAWVQLWPEPLRRSLYVGTENEPIGAPFINLRWLDSDGTRYGNTIRPGNLLYGGPERQGMALYSFVDGEATNSLHLMRNGNVFVREASSGSEKTRFLPFASYANKINYVVEEGMNIIPISFGGLFTAPPDSVQVTLATDAPQIYRYSVMNVTKDGCDVYVHRTASGTFNLGFHITAMQKENPIYAEYGD